MSEVTLQHDFIVAEQITAETILDFLEANKCILDQAGGKMQITNKIFPLIPQPLNKEVQWAKVTVTENLTIPPRSEMEVMAHIQFKEEGIWLLEGTMFKKLLICVTRALTVPRNQSALIRIVNLDTVPVTLYKNTKIANAELISDVKPSVVLLKVNNQPQTWSLI